MMAESGSVAHLIARYEQAIASYFRRRCATTEETEDLVQETCCAIIEGFDRLRNRETPGAWVMAICRNVFAHHVRREVNARSVLMTSDDETTGPNMELARMFLIDSLSPYERKLYTLRYVERRPIAEIASELMKPEGTVKYHLFRLRGRLRARAGSNDAQ
jgi:RNA polymerase sigma factor (sigma-70 family)